MPPRTVHHRFENEGFIGLVGDGPSWVRWYATLMFNSLSGVTGAA